MTRLERTGRLAAIPAGYALTSLITAVLVRVMPVRAVEAVSIAFLSFFAIYATMIVWAFGTRRIGRLWIIWGVAAALLAGYLRLPVAGTVQ
ncbi:iron transporter [Sphingomonas sp. CL5.1]|uniref:iron transporter n=1 Tax=Sphingomonas sp. CL5.1 TaxID=2653203 RepID=UPI0015826299|nr:iron transporter [Sphingomonas sp. CL5.1]QKR98376.1 iron transporter [Sphingomonas sp. CL5.1]